MTKHSPQLASRPRDPRLDAFRGLALMMIFINHVPRNFFENFTSRNFGFSDAAEAFVLMSGIAVGIAYSKPFRAGNYFQGCVKTWKRAGTLYTAHIVTTMLAIGILAAGVVVLDTTAVLRRVNFHTLMEFPFESMIGVPLLTHQLGYVNILPLYASLLLISPLYILIGLKSRLALILLAIVIWCLAGMYRLNFPNYPLRGGWFFNPVSWQLIYALGIAMGLAMAEGRSLVPRRSWLLALCAGYVLFSFIWIRMGRFGLPIQPYLPFFLGSMDKTFLALPRLLHIAALAYLVVNLPSVSRLVSGRIFAPLRLLGQQALSVFVVGTVLSIGLQVLRSAYDTNILHDTLLLGSGVMVQYGVAYFQAATSAKKSIMPAATIDPAYRAKPLPILAQSQSGSESSPIRSS